MACCRRWLAVGAPIVGLVALVSVPLATQSGEWLEEHEKETALLERHTHLADGLLPWSVAVFALLTLWWVWQRFGVARVDSRGLVRVVGIVGPVLLIAAGIGSLIEVVVIGHAGAVSVWKG